MALTAFSTSNAMATATLNYVDALSSVPDSWRNVVDWRTEESGALRITSLASIGEIATWDGSADLSSTATAAGSAGTKTISISQYASQVTIGRLDGETIPGLVDGMARRIGVAVANTYAKQVFNSLANCFTSEVTGDGKGFFANNHTIPGGSGTRSNLLTSSLDVAGVAAAYKAARQWVDATGAPYDLSAGGYWLVCGPDLEESAVQAVSSPYALTSVTTSGAPAQGLTNMVTQFLTLGDIIISPHFDDTNAWCLLPKLAPPLVAWQRLAPVLRMTQEPNTLASVLTVDYALTAACQVEPIGIGSNPS